MRDVIQIEHPVLSWTVLVLFGTLGVWFIGIAIVELYRVASGSYARYGQKRIGAILGAPLFLIMGGFGLWVAVADRDMGPYALELTDHAAIIHYRWSRETIPYAAVRQVDEVRRTGRRDYYVLRIWRGATPFECSVRYGNESLRHELGRVANKIRSACGLVIPAPMPSPRQNNSAVQ